MRTLLPIWSLAILLAACGRDTDGDGQPDADDCDSLDPSVFLGASETCNGRDDDCDGVVDEDVSIVAFWDRDRDGYGDDAYVSRVCAVPEDGVEVGGDCDDANAGVNPAAVESCNLLDDDCNGEIDDAGDISWYEDADGDGHGAGAPVHDGCEGAPGESAIADDCDDTEPLAWDGAAEVCDGVDNDCNGLVDDGAPLVRVWEDRDGDGYGDAALPTIGCGTGVGVADNALDCDDGDPDVSPDADDVQGNGLDEDCDGYVDEYGVPTPFATLDEALAAAPDGAVVQLDAGLHLGTADLRGRELTLAGEGCDRTTLYADSAGSVVLADGGRIENLTLSGGEGTVEGDLGAIGGGLLASGDTVASGVCFVGNSVPGSGAGAAVIAGVLTVEDSRFESNFASGSGGGAWAGDDGALVVLRSRFLANAALAGTGGGGGLATHGGALTVTDSTFAANFASDDGGAILVAYATDSLAVPETYTPGLATVDHCTFHANEAAGLVDGARGAAIFVHASDADTRASIFTGHLGEVEVVEDHDVGIGEQNLAADWVWSDLAFWGNGTFDREFFWIWDALHEEIRYANVDPAVPPAAWDLRLRPGSAGIDVGPGLDPDGTLADLGAWGGSVTEDSDGDGLEDAWEIWGGTNPWIADASSDADADGLPADDERSADSDPRLADTDGDGVDDAGDGLPTNPSDEAPFADAGLDRWGWVGTPVQVDGSASWDPNLEPLTFGWTVVAPGGSAVGAVDAPTAAMTGFTPDVAGTYTLTLTVSDGDGTHTDTVLVNVGSGIRVPDDADTVQEAVDLAADGGYVGIAPGTWTGLVDLGGKHLTLVGLGADPSETVLDGEGAGVVVFAGDFETLTIGNLTITGGSGGSAGGGIGAFGGAITLSRVIVRDNEATLGAGAKLNSATLVATDSVFANNHADLNGGGIYSLLGGLTVSRTSFLGNIADGDGGGVWEQNLGSNINRFYTFSSCLWQDNLANLGAAFFSAGPYATNRVTITNATFVHNPGESVVYSDDGTMLVVSSVFWDDASTDATVTGSSFGPQYAAHAVTSGPPLVAFWGAPILEWPSDIPIVDPALVRYVANDDPDDDLPYLRPTSSLIDGGMALPVYHDADGTRSDAGVTGGPDAIRSLARFARDDDADGLSDGWEVAFGLDPLVDDSAGDADGDGVSNLAEYLAHTAP